MASFSTRLLAWYRNHGRDLPWRNTMDPYAIFMSELMLQQTQVDRVIPLWEEWLRVFPTWQDLAQAKTPQLLHAWAGLGYNRRALYAREAAQEIITQGIPQTEAAWRKLKGVGPYMAAALAAFISHERALVIDTNVRRVMGRVFLGHPFPAPAEDAAIFPLLEEHTPHRGRHWDIPQALMDLASQVCTNTKPACSQCPLRELCHARHLFEAQPDLRKQRQAPRETIREGKDFPDRIYRGRLLAWIREHGPMPIAHLGHKVDPTYTAHDADWIHSMLQRMEKDGLISLEGPIASLAS